MLRNSSNNWRYEVPRNMKTFCLFKENIADVFLNNQPYQISSTIPDRQVSAFLDHLIKGDNLFITVDNIGNYIQLADELCKERLKILFNKRCGCLYKIHILKYRKYSFNDNDERYISFIQMIAKDLDYYLEYLCDELFQIPIQILEQIFRMADFEKHNLAYTAILNKSANDSDYYILIKYLDNLKLSADNLIDAYRNSSIHCGFIPEKNNDHIVVSTTIITTIRNITYICLGAIGGGLYVFISYKRR